jgi:hypothetical protein
VVLQTDSDRKNCDNSVYSIHFWIHATLVVMLPSATEVVKQEANHPGGFVDGLLP